MRKILIIYGKETINYPHVLTDDEEMQGTAFLIANILRKNKLDCYLLGLEKDLKILGRWIKKEKWIVFNLCEHLDGDYRKEYKVAKYLEKNKIPFTGNSSFTLKIAQDKKASKKILMKAKLPVPAYTIFKREDKKIFLPFNYPVIVKPLFQDGSSGINEHSVVYNKKRLKAQIDFIFDNFKDPAMVEPFLGGREFNVSVIGREKRIALPPSEIDYSNLPSSIPKILTYKAKWAKNDLSYELTKPICPAKISKKLEGKLKSIALKTGKALGCRDYYRVDFRTDEKGNVYIIEVNPNPDISPDAGLARALNSQGINYDDFILRLVQWAS